MVEPVDASFHLCYQLRFSSATPRPSPCFYLRNCYGGFLICHCHEKMQRFILFFTLLAIFCRRGSATIHVSNMATYHEGRLMLVPHKSSTSALSLCRQSNGTSSGRSFASHRLPDGALLDLCLESAAGASFTALLGSESYAGSEAIQLERKLVGSGAHRELITSITVGLEKCEECHMVTIEQLSSGVFADMFELQGLVARAVYDGAAIYGDHNLELPALHSLESMVVVHTRFNSKSGHALQAQVSVPLHARYPRLSLDGHAVVDIKFPSLLFQCSCKGGNPCVSFADSSMEPRENVSWALLTMKNVKSSDLQWYVPAGNPQHASIVASLTALFSMVGVVILWVVSMRSYKSHKTKVA